jgi:hypothetical protein
MQTHVIITGHARTFAHCWPNLRWNVINRLENPVIHASVEPDDDAEKMRQTLEKTGLPFHFRTVTQPAPEDFPDYGYAYRHAPYAISVAPYAIVTQLWRMRDGYLDAAPMIGERDTVVRLRPDLWFHEPISMAECDLNLPGSVNYPWWGNFGGINDRFAIMPAKRAQDYFDAYPSINQAISEGCPLHPESLVAYACRNVPKKRCNFLFSTMRPTGQRWPEILPGEFPPFRP